MKKLTLIALFSMLGARANAIDLLDGFDESLADTAYGEYLGSECLTCHNATGTDTGIPKITGIDKKVVYQMMQSYKQEVLPNPTMQMIAKKLSSEELISIAAYLEELN